MAEITPPWAIKEEGEELTPAGEPKSKDPATHPDYAGSRAQWGFETDVADWRDDPTIR